MKQKIAFLISENYHTLIQKCPDFLDEFKLLSPIFADLGAELIQVDWRDAAQDWQKFSLLTPKACWDYAEHPVEYELFLKKIMQQKIPMQNSAATVLWNMRKTYLLDLKAKGLRVAELLLIPQNHLKSGAELLQLIEQAGFAQHQRFVAKPSVGGGAIDTVRFSKEDIEQQATLFTKILGYADLILQPYFPEIAEEGEYSYFFFGNQFSHAILKKPASGDYRAHQLYGAKNVSYTPKQTEIEQAFQFVSALNTTEAYARVDVFMRNGQLYLIELELIEPYLYFELAPKAATRKFCEALLSKQSR